MDPVTLVSIAAAVFAFGLVSHRLEGTPLTAPLFFVVAGALLGPHGVNVIRLDPVGESTRILIEGTLVLVLFTDASRIRFGELRRGYRLPARMLLVGLPLTIGFGLLVARPIFPSMTWAELALLAAVLAPTDAALGQVVVSSERVPVRIRQALNVESGLNDGIAVPVVVMLLAAASQAAHAPAGGPAFALAQIGLGPLAGAGVALPAGWLAQRAADSNAMSPAFQRLAGVAVALGAFGVAELVGGNGFIAAFTAGLVVGNMTRTVCSSLREFAEDEGQLLALISFLVFGAVLLPPALASLDGSAALYVALSLTIVRVVPVALALLGTGLRLPTVAFLGWFGPRGLATILFALLVAENTGIPHHERLFEIIALAVGASVVAHGLTAVPLASRYGRWFAGLHAADPSCPEGRSAPDIPMRVRTREQRVASEVAH